MELKRLQSEVGITFVFVTHDQTEALALSDRIAVMRAGKVVQVGAPRDIYERPASRFVAEFVGESNVLEAESLGDARFRLGCGAVIEASNASAAGTRTTLTIRPERARLVAPGQGVPAIVEQIVYLGTDTMHHLRFADGAPFRVRDQNRGSAPRTPPGGAVAVLLPPEALRVLPD
jgi:spermidine/putrescine transport system ATP-binding protein